MPPPDSVHDGRLVGAITSKTANGRIVWADRGDDTYYGTLDGHEIARLKQTDAGVWELWVGRRKVDHPSVGVLFDAVEGPFAAKIRQHEEGIIDA